MSYLNSKTSEETPNSEHKLLASDSCNQRILNNFRQNLLSRNILLKHCWVESNEKPLMPHGINFLQQQNSHFHRRSHSKVQMASYRRLCKKKEIKVLKDNSQTHSILVKKSHSSRISSVQEETQNQRDHCQRWILRSSPLKREYKPLLDISRDWVLLLHHLPPLRKIVKKGDQNQFSKEDFKSYSKRLNPKHSWTKLLLLDLERILRVSLNHLKHSRLLRQLL